jgi:serine/threonine protein kinase
MVSEFPHIAGLKIHGELGRGGMARVYRAEQTALGREVAVKLVTPRRDEDLTQLPRLENEARALAELHHPNIVELYDFGRTEDGGMYYVMPMLVGGDLRRLGAPIAEDRVVAWLDSMLDALAHAHALGVVHRDIKPENILFDRNDRPLLADFGAALRRRRTRLTAEGLAIGSTGYMSPEQARGAEVDARSDLYSLGVVAFELLTGHLPFDGPDALAIALAQIEKPVPTLPAALAHWQAFFDRALACEPAWRFASAIEMRAALDALEAEPAAPASSAALWLRLGLPLGAAAVLLLVALFWLSREPALDLDQIEHLLSSGQLLPPATPNALDALLAAGNEERDSLLLRALRERLLSALRDEQLAALGEQRLDRLAPLWSRWQQAVGALQAQSEPMVIEHNRRVEAALQSALKGALQRFDRADGRLALSLVDASTMASKSLLELASQVRALPVEGESFSDPGGPPLRLLQRPQPDRPGYALMQQPADPALFAQFRGAASDCAAPVASVQGCVEHAKATQFAAWLSRRTGQRYRLPDRSELRAALPELQRLPVQVWTSECRLQSEPVERPGALKRAWGRIRSALGARSEAPAPRRRCVGYWTLALDGSQQERVMQAADPATTVLLLREL